MSAPDFADFVGRTRFAEDEAEPWRVAFEHRQNGALCLVEQRDITYRESRRRDRRAGRPIQTFGFRALRRFFLGMPVRLRGGMQGGDSARVRALTPAGDAGMQAEVEFW